MLLSALVLLSCGPYRAGVYLLVEGKEFSDAELLIDGRTVGRFKQVPASPSSEAGTTSAGKTADQHEYAGHFDYFSLKPGKHNMVLVATNGKRLEIVAHVSAGENYVTYSSHEQVLRWNDDKYQAVPGQPVFVDQREKKGAGANDGGKMTGSGGGV